MLTSLERTLVVVVVCSSPAFAQTRPATQPSTSASAAATTGGQFVVGPFYAGPRIWLGNLNGAMAIGGQIEKGFSQPGKYGPGIISGGLGIDYYSWDWDYLGAAGYSYSVIPIQIFSNYHFVIESNKKLDPYAGLAFVYSLVNASWKGSGTEVSADGNYTDIAGQAGVRYFVTPKIAVQGQIGFGYGTLGLGATWKF